MKIGLLISGHLGYTILQKFFNEQNLEFVFTDSQSKKIIDYCSLNKLHCFVGNPRKINYQDFLLNKSIDLLLSVNYLFIIPRVLLDHPLKYAINIHGSLLPKYRGRTPHVWAIINNEKETGVTAHLMSDKCDEGDIILQHRIVIDENATGNDLLKKYENIYPLIVKEVISLVEAGNILGRKQNELYASYFGKRTPEDGLINWDWQKERIRNWVRAMAAPYPGAFAYYSGKKIIINKVVFSDYGFNLDQPNGQIRIIDNAIFVKTPNGLVQLADYSAENNIQFKDQEIFDIHN